MGTIVQEEPYVAVVDNPYLDSNCSHCFMKSSIPDKALLPCPRCRVVRYCDRTCQSNDWPIHRHECPLFVSVAPNIPQSKARLLTRLLIRRYKGESTSVKAFNGRCFDDLMDHVEEIKQSTEHLPLFTSICANLPQFLPEKYMVEMPELLRYFGRAVINCFGITGDDQVTVGEGIYLGLSALNHSCAPDAFVRFQGRTAILRTANVSINGFSNQLTIPYTNLDTLTSERRANLKKQYFFTCNCRVCTDPLRDGYARSLQCSECTTGSCLVVELDEVITCDTCGAVNATPVDEAFRMNQEIEWQLEKEKDKKDIFNNLKSDMNLFAKYESTLSKYNLPLASLAYRIVNLALSIDRRDDALRHAYKYLDAFRRYLPTGHPLLTSSLQTAAIAASFSDPPTGKVLFLLEEARSACILSHGGGPLMTELNSQTEMYRSRMHSYRMQNQ